MQLFSHAITYSGRERRVAGQRKDAESDARKRQQQEHERRRKGADARIPQLTRSLTQPSVARRLSVSRSLAVACTAKPDCALSPLSLPLLLSRQRLLSVHRSLARLPPASRLGCCSRHASRCRPSRLPLLLQHVDRQQICCLILSFPSHLCFVHLIPRPELPCTNDPSTPSYHLIVPSPTHAVVAM